MIDLTWLSNSIDFHKSVKDSELVDNAKGGVVYNFQFYNSLKKIANVSLPAHYCKNENEKFYQYCFRINKNVDLQSNVIIEPYLLPYLKFNSSINTFLIFHHLNTNSPFYNIKVHAFNKLFIAKLKKIGKVIVVSEFWENYLMQHGITNTFKIYNSFDISNFKIEREAQQIFKNKYQIPSNRPIIYIGSMAKGKGALENYKILKNLPYTLISSGYTPLRFLPNLIHLTLKQQEFYTLLKISDVVLTMSSMMEGWNRLAHEAMLLKTPVIGSGIGGMHELLSKGKQIICRDFNQLAILIEDVLAKKRIIGEDGFSFVKQFNMDYFQQRLEELFYFDANGIIAKK